MNINIETGFHDDANAYVNVTFDSPMTGFQVECANDCAREAGRAFARMLDDIAWNGKQWTDYAEEVQWYDGHGEEVVDEEDFNMVRTVQCMVCAVD